MKLSTLNDWLTLVANIGVLIGVFLLVYELRQTNLATEAQTRAEIASRTVDAMFAEMADPVFYDATIRYRAGEALSPREALTMSTASRATFRRWENMHYQHRVGLYAEAEFAANLRSWKSLLTVRGYLREHWRDNAAGFSPAFAADIDRLLEEIDSEQGDGGM